MSRAEVRWFALPLVCLASGGLTACSGLWVAASAVAVVGGGALAAECYENVMIDVRDARSGRALCDADVWLSAGDQLEPAKPCFHAALTPGTWQVHAELPGYQRQTSQVVVEPAGEECSHAVHSVELVLEPARPVWSARN